MPDNDKKTLDYGTFLADLERKRAALDQAIVSLKAVIAGGAIEGISSVNLAATIVSSDIHGGEVPAGAFFGKSIPEATKLYLSIVKQKQTTREIAEGLQKGGMETTSANFEGIVAAGINRASKKDGEIVKVGRAWALAAWYPAGIRAAAQEKRNGRKHKKSRIKGRASKPEPKPVAVAVPPVGPKPTERILQILQAGTELSPQELADLLGMKAKVVQMILGKMVLSKILAKMPGGKYRMAA